MKFTMNGTRVHLQSIKQDLTRCSSVSKEGLKGLINRQVATHCLQFRWEAEPDELDEGVCAVTTLLDKPNIPELQVLLEQYADLFQEPSSLRPIRPFDHSIHLIPGAQPINVRPYRYFPAQKVEIEEQLQEMLKSGIIKFNDSPYASPVLLVRKKDGSWRFCVDYRHLNAQTVKNKHPMPVVEELIDELTGAHWFSKLDFRAGYHQICITPEDTHKIAFRTHSGLYEFLVMPFGLTNALATF